MEKQISTSRSGRRSRLLAALIVTVLASDLGLKAQGPPAVHGTGTANTVPLWTGTTAIANSALNQSGGNLSTSGSMTAASFTGNGSGLTNVNAATLGNLPASSFAQLAAGSNAFSGSVSIGGILSGATISSGNGGFQFGSTQVLSILPGLFNLYVGQSAGQGAGASNTGTQNSSTGYQTLFLNTTGSYNTAVGTSALYSNTTGANNTAAGDFALNKNSTGVDNTALGMEALLNNTTGGLNTATGTFALHSNTTGAVNTATGNNALLSNTTGSRNTGIGDGSLYYSTTGNDNTAVGRLSLTALLTGSNNVAIGSNAGTNFNGAESNNIDINNGGATGESGVIRVGDPNNQTAAFIAGINGVTTGSVTTSTVLVDSNGQLGTIASSRRYKEDIHDMGVASDGLLRLHPVTFRYKKAYADGSKPVQYGLIAEEVAEVYPDLVVRGKDGQPETVQYYKLDAMLLNEVQKLAGLHHSDEQEIAADQKRISELQRQIDDQRKQFDEQQVTLKQLLAQVRVLQASVSTSHSRPEAVSTSSLSVK